MIKPAAKSRGGLCGGSWSQVLPPLRKCISVRLLRISFAVLPLFVGGLKALCDSRPSEYEIKAAYLLNFGKFVRNPQTVPTGSGNSFDICLVGNSPIEAPLRALTANENIGDRPVRVLRMKDGTDARSCQIVYLSESEGSHLEEELKELRGADVLTVSDRPDFLAQGGMIEFVLISDHVRFSVSLDSVRRTHLVLSSEFLRVAYSVSKGPGKESAP